MQTSSKHAIIFRLDNTVRYAIGVDHQTIVMAIIPLLFVLGGVHAATFKAAKDGGNVAHDNNEHA